MSLLGENTMCVIIGLELILCMAGIYLMQTEQGLQKAIGAVITVLGLITIYMAI